MDNSKKETLTDGKLDTSIESLTMESNSSLQQLPSVLIHMCMQLLDFVSLATLSRTCKLMHSSSLHRSAGRFLTAPSIHSPLYCSSILDGTLDEHGESMLSPLFQTHMPVRVHLPSHDLYISSLQPLVGFFKRITSIVCMADGGGSGRGGASWSERQILDLLAESWVVSDVSSVESIQSDSVWMRSSLIQAALFSLPCLTHVGFEYVFDDFEEEGRVVPEALALATHLTHVTILIRFPADLSFLNHLSPEAKVKHLTIGAHEDGYVAWSEIAAIVPILLAQLSHVTLTDFPMQSSRAECNELKIFVEALKNVEQIEVSCYNIKNVMRACISAAAAGVGEGGSSLSTLRTFHCCGRVSSSTLPTLRSFVDGFSLVNVMVEVTSNRDEAKMKKEFGDWPQITIIKRLNFTYHASEFEEDLGSGEAELEGQEEEAGDEEEEDDDF